MHSKYLRVMHVCFFSDKSRSSEHPMTLPKVCCKSADATIYTLVKIPIEVIQQLKFIVTML